MYSLLCIFFVEVAEYFELISLKDDCFFGNTESVLQQSLQHNHFIADILVIFEVGLPNLYSIFSL